MDPLKEGTQGGEGKGKYFWGSEKGRKKKNEIGIPSSGRPS